jgi:hypothetical protein
VKALTCAKAVAVNRERRLAVDPLKAPAALQAHGNVAQEIRPLAQVCVDKLAWMAAQRF